MGRQDKKPRVRLKSSLREINYYFLYFHQKKEQQAELDLIPGYTILPNSQIPSPSLPVENPPKSMPHDS